MDRKTLIEKIFERRSFLCVGLDSDMSKLPACLASDHDAMFTFNRAIIDATAPYCVAYKPNAAFYEAAGIVGESTLQRTAQYLKEYYPDHFLILDAKRGDIGNTARMYARSAFDILGCDAVTVAPYMGSDSVLDLTSGSSFTSNGYTFHYSYNAQYGSWSGFTVSGKKDTSFKDYTTDKNSCVGHGFSGNFAVYYPTWGTPSTIDLPGTTAFTVRGFYGAVNTYVQNSIVNGDSYAKKFTHGSWLRLDCIGVKADGTQDTVSYYLAEYLGNQLNYAKDWTWFDLTPLGDVKQVYFAFDGSDKGTYGLNTPTYLLLDDFNGIYDNKHAVATKATR